MIRSRVGLAQRGIAAALLVAVSASACGGLAAPAASGGSVEPSTPADPSTTSPVDPSPSIVASATADQPAAPVAGPPAVSVAFDGRLSWAYLDRATGANYASANADQTSYTESMIKAWLAADDFTLSDENGTSPDLDLIVPMIIDSDDDAAETLYWRDGGDAGIERMIEVCQLTDTTITDAWWSETMMSARDAVRLGDCIADGSAASPQWTSWLLNEMRQVRGEGRFGIINAVSPAAAATLSIKNGWTMHYDDNTWRVNCLAIDDNWVLAVMLVYSGNYGLDYGANACASVARQVLNTTG